MRIAIDFHYELCRRAQKIDDGSPDDLLTSELKTCQLAT